MDERKVINFLKGLTHLSEETGIYISGKASLTADKQNATSGPLKFVQRGDLEWYGFFEEGDK